MMQLQTPVALPKENITIDEHSKIMFIGSCFADNVGTILGQRMPEGNVNVNPFGVLYNPISISKALRLLMNPESFNTEKALFEGRDALWHSWFHTSHFSSPTKEKCLMNVVESIKASGDFLASADILVITFGTTRCYNLKEEDFVVANCHKEPQARFNEIDPEMTLLIDDWKLMMKDIRAFNPRLKIIFTVSPYRYRKYGFHESQVQKSKLLLLVDSLVNDAKNKEEYRRSIFYFPSYEIVLDELRDYRFYKADMLHPSEQAVEYIAQRFEEWSFTEGLSHYVENKIKELKRQGHVQR